MQSAESLLYKLLSCRGFCKCKFVLKKKKMQNRNCHSTLGGEAIVKNLEWKLFFTNGFVQNYIVKGQPWFALSRGKKERKLGVKGEIFLRKKAVKTNHCVSNHGVWNLMRKCCERKNHMVSTFSWTINYKCCNILLSGA